MWFLVVGIKKGLIVREKDGASRDMNCCSRDEESAYRSRERWPREMWFVVVGMEKGLIDSEKGGLEDSSWHVEHCTE